MIAAALFSFVLGGAVVTSAPLSADPDKDLAVATAFRHAAILGEINPRLASIRKGDAAILREAGEEIAPGVSGTFWVITLTGNFDYPKGPPEVDVRGRGGLHTLVLYVREGKVSGLRGSPSLRAVVRTRDFKA